MKRNGPSLFCLLVFSLACVLCFSSPRAYGQAATAGAILGTVSDPSGAVIADAQVTIANTATQQTRVVTTNTAGFYTAEALSASTYDVTVKKEGFETFISKGVKLDPGERLALNVSLKVGSPTTEITVTAATVKIETSTGESGGVISGNQIQQLMLNGRNIQGLGLLVPGVNPLKGGSALGSGGFGGGDATLSINGMGREVDTYTVDGAFNMNTGCNCAINITTPLDTVSEFRIMKDNYSAKYGVSGNAVVAIETKSGTQEFHGNVFEYLRNDALDAKNFFDVSKTPLKQHDFGFSLGGPFYIPGKYNTEKKKAFFFVNEDWRRHNAGLTLRGAMIPQAMRNGDFTKSPTLGPLDPTNPNSPPSLKFDSVALNFKSPSCIIDSTHLDPSCFDPNAVLLMNQFWPLPNNPAGGFNNYINPGVDLKTQRNDTYRVDYIISQRLSLTARFMHEIATEDLPALTWGPNPAPTTTQTLGQTSFNSLLRFSANISPTTINQFTFVQTHDKPRLRDHLDTYPSALTLIKPFPNADIHNRIPTINISKGWAGIGAGPMPIDASDGEITISDDFTKVKGSHVIQAGALYIFGIKRQNLFSNTYGVWGFNGLHSNDPVADYLLGLDSSFFQTSGERRGYFRYRQFEAYIQDDWKLTPRLSLNLGLREVYFSPDKMEGNGFSDFDPKRWDPAKAPTVQSNGQFVLDANGNPLTGAGTPADVLNGVVIPEGFKGLGNIPPGTPGVSDGIFLVPKFNLGPRVGFAWDVFGDGKSSLRGGYGIGYTRIPFGQYVSMNNLPFIDSVSLINGTLTDPAAGVAGAKTPSGLNIIGPPGGTFKPTGVQTWSLTGQRELIPNGVLSVAYVGSGARHVKGSLDFNFPRTGIGPSINDPKCLQPGQDPNGIYDFDPCLNNGLVSADFTRPYVGWSGFSSGHGAGTYFGTSNYHSLQVGWKYRPSQSLTLTTAYTWGKVLTDVADRGASDGRNTGAGAQNPRDFKLEYGPPGWDRTHVFSAGYIWNLPAFKNRTDLVGKALGGWTFSGITLVESGFALGPGLSIATPGLASRPNLVGSVSGPKTVAKWFNTDAFAPAAFGIFGNAGTGLIRGPGENTWNWALYKSFPLGERAKLEFRSEFFNIWNHPSFTAVQTAFGAGNYGEVTSALDPRILELALRIDF